jgi:hypothetical protein
LAEAEGSSKVLHWPGPAIGVVELSRPQQAIQDAYGQDQLHLKAVKGYLARGSDGSLLDANGYGLSAYAIDGFEHPAAPISSEDDQGFTSAIDSVQSHLSSDGAFYVAFDVGSQISGDELDFVDYNYP